VRAIIYYSAEDEIIITDITDYNITLSSTPLNSNDTSGTVGDFSITFLRPYDPDNHINVRGPSILEGKVVHFESDFGSVSGYVDTVEARGPAEIVLQCSSNASGLNSYNVQATPLRSSSLEGALKYYFSLGISDQWVNVVVDPEIADRGIVYPGWSGELWHHLKMLCAAEDIELVLGIFGTVQARPVRKRNASSRNLTEVSVRTDSSNIAQSIEVYEYNCSPAVGELFYPRGGWSEDVEILSVNAGEYTEQSIELAGSMETFQEPQMYDFVERDWTQSSTYTIVADDGFPVPIQQWRDSGGLISFELNDDFRTMTVKMKGATGIRMDDGNKATSFSLALSSDSGGSSRYSTLRIVGDGVLHDHENKLQVATGIPEELTGTDVGATIDNPFLFDRERVAKAAARAVKEFSGAVLTAQITATEVSKDVGIGSEGDRIDIDGRPFRIRETNYTPGVVSINLDDDLIHQEVEDALEGMTYQQVEDENEGLTYRNVFSRGRNYGNGP